jgi:hypothetical protein
MDGRNGLIALLNGGAHNAAENLPEGLSAMSHDGRTLVIVLSMHRSGSSLFTNILQAHGMSLGPFDLIGADPSNPHGHFEARPLHSLNREVQALECGFADDFPGSPETLTQFLESPDTWDGRTEVPEEWVERGRDLIRRLVESDPISGFKDPRTVLVWSFWRRVLEAFPEVRVVPVVLLRTPHEIAMSLFTRGRGAYSYRTCLDVTAVHLRRLAAIVDGWPEPVARVRFGGPEYEDDLARAIANCGLVWDPETGRRCFDATCVHHESAVVAHESQRLHDALCGADQMAAVDPIRNLAIVEADASARESLYRERGDRDRDEIHALRRRIDDLQNLLTLAEETSRTNYDNWQDAHRSWQEVLRASQEAHRSSQEAHRSSQEAHRSSQEAHRSSQEAHRSSQEAHQGWRDAVVQLEATRQELGRYRGLCEEARELACAQSRQLDAVHGEVVHLQGRLIRFDSHPVLGPILRGRRRVKGVLNGLRLQGDDR